MNWLKTATALVALLLVFVLAALSVNQEEVTLSFAVWETPFPLSVFWWLMAAFLIGLLFGLLNAAWLTLKSRLTIRRLNQSLTEAQGELARLRGAADP